MSFLTFVMMLTCLFVFYRGKQVLKFLSLNLAVRASAKDRIVDLLDKRLCEVVHMHVEVGELGLCGKHVQEWNHDLPLFAIFVLKPSVLTLDSDVGKRVELVIIPERRP